MHRPLVHSALFCCSLCEAVTKCIDLHCFSAASEKSGVRGIKYG